MKFYHRARQLILDIFRLSIPLLGHVFVKLDGLNHIVYKSNN